MAGNAIRNRIAQIILEKAANVSYQHFEDAEFMNKMTQARREASSRPLELANQTLDLLRQLEQSADPAAGGPAGGGQVAGLDGERPRQFSLVVNQDLAITTQKTQLDDRGRRRGRGGRARGRLRRLDVAERAAAAAGEGIGLALVREIVEGHGGRVGASSPGQGKGATFWVVLPRDGIPVKPNAQEGAPTHGSDPVGSASGPQEKS